MRGSLKRFVALATICALGVTMICGLKVACIDLRASADRFFDEQDLFDLRVQSTLGITDDDVAALAALDGVETAEGGWVETCYTAVGSGSEKVDVKALSASGLNQPRLLEGHLPVTADQVAVTRRYLKESGKSIGDTLSFRGSSDDDEDATKVFARKDYTICGVVLDPTDVNAGEGTMSFRASGSSQYAFFLLPAAVESEVYTVAYVKVAGSEAPLCYSDAYEDLVGEVKSRVEGIAGEREAARGEGLRADANSQVDDAEKDALDKLADGQRQIDENQEKLDSGAAQIADGRAQLDAQGADAERQMADAQAKIDAGRSELAANEQQVADGLQQIANGLGCSVDAIPDAISQKRAQLNSAQEELTYNRGVIDGSARMLSALMGDEWPADAWSRLSSATTEQEARAAASEVNAALLPFAEKATSFIDQLMQIVDSEEFRQIAASYDSLPPELRQRVDEVLDLLPASVREAARQILAASANADQILAQLQSLRDQLSQLTGLADGMVQIVVGQAQVDAGRAQLDEAAAAYARLDAARSQLAAGRAELDAGQAQLDAQRKSAQEQLDAARSQLEAGAQELADGQAQLEAARAEFAQQRADALAAIADARDQISSIDDAAWYVQDRTSLASYSSVESDAGSIEAIGTALPVVFFVVAVLISLTTMTRMVEEERGLIGLYKALGYGRGRILSKYVVYASAACLAGGIAGNPGLCGAAAHSLHDLLDHVRAARVLFELRRRLRARVRGALCRGHRGRDRADLPPRARRAAGHAHAAQGAQGGQPHPARAHRPALATPLVPQQGDGKEHLPLQAPLPDDGLRHRRLHGASCLRLRHPRLGGGAFGQAVRPGGRDPLRPHARDVGRRPRGRRGRARCGRAGDELRPGARR